MTIRINPPALPPMNDGDAIARHVFAVIANGGALDADELKSLVDFRHPNGLGRTFSAMLILARQAVRTVAGQGHPINEPRVHEVERFVDIERIVIKEVPIEVREVVEKLPDKRVCELVDQILGDIGAAAMTARGDKRNFGVADLRPIIERNLR